MIKIAVASGKGGTGKTFVATNLFRTLTVNNTDALLVDCDAEAPNAAAFFNAVRTESADVTHLVPVIDTELCTFCGKCHEYCSYNAIFILPPAKVIKVIEDLCHGCGACTEACSFGAVTEKPVRLGTVSVYNNNPMAPVIEARMDVGVMSPVPVIKAAIKKARNGKEVAILDSPPGTSCPFIQTVATADFVVLVTEPTPFGLSDLRQSVDTLRSMGIASGVIINRAGLGNGRMHDYLKENSIPLLMEIPFDETIARVYSEGKLLADTDHSYRKRFTDLYTRINALIRKS